MSLKLMYITNRPEIAEIAEETGVDRIFADMEYIGKEERQAGLDCVKYHHTISDVIALRKKLKNAELMVRVNPIHDATSDYCNSEDEINQAIDAGAEVIMLPMYRSMKEVEELLRIVDRRVKIQLLTETLEACEIMDQVVKLPEVDEIHIGLNDLHLAMHRKFMFELLADGTVDKICNIIKESDKPFGFGGIARIGYGMLPAEYIIKEHYRIGSGCAILSRAFCNANKIRDVGKVQELFEREMVKIRETEKLASQMSNEEFEENRQQVKRLVDTIVSKM